MIHSMSWVTYDREVFIRANWASFHPGWGGRAQEIAENATPPPQTAVPPPPAFHHHERRSARARCIIGGGRRHTAYTLHKDPLPAGQRRGFKGSCDVRSRRVTGARTQVRSQDVRVARGATDAGAAARVFAGARTDAGAVHVAQYHRDGGGRGASVRHPVGAVEMMPAAEGPRLARPGLCSGLRASMRRRD
ncbi:hypothetical protein JB92DRAFT_3092076 [Gautieria morchelliformis]|nr:hypothetical protein JB92DRAFT_3092076 [Gautieria morchelliformis]